MDTEVLRQLYKPDKVKLLLIGESPPGNGNFFYHKGAMTTFTARAFERAYNVNFTSHLDFLNFFTYRGCYLDDICHSPIDHLPSKEREKCLINNVAPFADRIKKINPQFVIAVLKKIEKHVRTAIDMSARNPVFYVLPFPGNGHQTKYIEQLSLILDKLLPRKE